MAAKEAPKGAELVAVFVASGRTIHTEEGAHTQGQEILLDADEAERLIALGFAVPEIKEEVPASSEGPSVTTEGDGPAVTVSEG
jgi:hypothetical protein